MGITVTADSRYNIRWYCLLLHYCDRDANSCLAEMLDFSERGDNEAVDMLVGDIYGQDYSKLGLLQ